MLENQVKKGDFSLQAVYHVQCGILKQLTELKLLAVTLTGKRQYHNYLKRCNQLTWIWQHGYCSHGYMTTTVDIVAVVMVTVEKVIINI